MCWIDWVMSTVPMSKYDVDFEETQEDTLGLRQSGNDYQVIMFDIILDITIFWCQSINGLTQNDCGDFKENNPDLFRWVSCMALCFNGFLLNLQLIKLIYISGNHLWCMRPSTQEEQTKHETTFGIKSQQEARVKYFNQQLKVNKKEILWLMLMFLTSIVLSECLLNTLWVLLKWVWDKTRSKWSIDAIGYSNCQKSELNSTSLSVLLSFLDVGLECCTQM